jgi:hypothetical protein
MNKKKVWVRRGLIAALLIAPSMALAAVEMSDSDTSLCEFVSQFFSCESTSPSPCQYSK